MSKKNTPKAEQSPQTGFSCPIAATHDKFDEAHYFISRMVKEYHNPEPFRWNLNAFLQALRSVTFMIQAELTHTDGFAVWYEEQREWMKSDRLLKIFDDGRDYIVHKGMLTGKSRVEAGIFRGRKLKLAITADIPADRSSEDVLRLTVDQFTGFTMDAEHSAVDEQLGVRRVWLIDELGGDEVVSLCDQAWSRIGKVVSGAHLLVKSLYDGPLEDVHHEALGTANVLLESDVDPSLPRKWGW